MTLFWQKTSLKIEKDSYLSQNIWYFDKIKSFWKLMICFCYFCQKKCFSFRVWPIMTPFCANWSHKKTIFERFYQLFFRTNGCNTSYWYLLNPLTYFIGNQPKKVKWVWTLGPNLGQIRSNVVKKKKKKKKKKRNWDYQWAFFKFCMRNTFKSKKWWL